MWKCKEWWNIQPTPGIWCGRLGQHPLPPVTHQGHSLILSSQTIKQKKAKNTEMGMNSQEITLYYLGLRRQNPGLREIHLKPSPKKGSDKIKMVKEGRKTPAENKSYHTAWTHIRIPALRELDLEPSAQRGATRTEALVSLYWTSRNLHPKEPPHQISHKSTKVDPIRSSRTWKKSNHISKSCSFQHIKTFFPRNARSANAHDWGHKWGRHTQR